MIIRRWVPEKHWQGFNLIEQLVESGVAIGLAMKLVIKFSYGYLCRRKNNCPGKVTAGADILP